MLILTWNEMDETAAMDDAASERTDEDLLRAFQNGDEGPFEILFRRYEHRLVGYLTHLTSNLDVGRDLAQETFLKLIRKPPLFLTNGSIKSWLFRVGRNLAMDHLRRRKRRSDFQDHHLEKVAEDTTPADTARRADDLAQVQEELERLPEDLRDVVCQRMYGNLTFKEISKISKIPLGTALWRMRRALEEMKKNLRNAGYEK